jgi:hypothetical protein
VPILISSSQTFTRIAFQTGGSWSGTGDVRLGIYNADATTGKPTTVLLDAGTVSATTASTLYQITISQTLQGAYWLALCVQTVVASNALSVMTGVLTTGFNISTGDLNTLNTCWRQSSVAGAFATAGTLTLINEVPIIALRT